MFAFGWRPALALAALALGSPLQFAHAQGYPSTPIRLLPGSGVAVEVLMRQIGQEMQAGLGQPLVIEARPGGTGIIAGEACAKSAPDGYTLCLVDRTFPMLPLLMSHVPFDVSKDFDPVTNVVFTVLALVVHPSVPARDLKELIALARAKPDQLNFASLGPATLANMLMEWLKKQNGVSVVQVRYKNPGTLMTAVIAGETQLTYFGLANFTGYHRSGKLRVIGVSGAKRSPLVPEVPTLIEQGLTGIDTRVWFGWFSPAGTPHDLRERIYREVLRIESIPAFREKNFTAQAFEPIANSPDEFAQFIKADSVSSAELIRISGAHID